MSYTLDKLTFTTRDVLVPFTMQIVTPLLDGYCNQGHIIFLDNYYSSPDLFLTLEKECGSVHVVL